MASRTGPSYIRQNTSSPEFSRPPARRTGTDRTIRYGGRDPNGPTLPTTRPPNSRAPTRMGGAGVSRAKTLTRPERHLPRVPLINPTASAGMPGTIPGPLGAGHTATSATAQGSQAAWYSPWPLFVTILTLPIPGFLLTAFGIRDPVAQQAWREKVALCIIIVVIGGAVGFITIGLNKVLCPDSATTGSSRYVRVNATPGLVAVQGWQFNVTSAKITPQLNLLALAMQESGIDVTPFFDRSQIKYPSCNGLTAKFATSNLCANATSATAVCVAQAPNDATFQTLGITNTSKIAGYAWDQVAISPNFIVLDGAVLNMNSYIYANPTPIKGDTVDTVIRYVLGNQPASGGKDATRLFYNTAELQKAGQCLRDRYTAGHIDKISPGCFVSQLFLYTSLVVILSVVLCRFSMAIFFSWFLSSRLVRPPKNLRRKVVSPAVMPDGANLAMGSKNGAAPWAGNVGNHRGAANNRLLKVEKPGQKGGAKAVDANGLISMASIGAELFCICLVTAYSEGEAGIRSTLDSIAGCEYSDARKLLFVVCDGMITGSGEKKSTPDICVEMLDADPRFGNPTPMSYRAVASGQKEHNEAMVYAGHYTNVRGRRTPTIIVVKCGTPAEATDKKPGNRGKRDSQMILMNFFSRVTYNDRMTPLDYDLFRKIQSLMGVTPDFFEVCLMVDADTTVAKDSMTHLVNCMQHDPYIMGVCGETRIANKRQSWVTAIQVFEYYISHHLAKAFESVFGGVTCLPGCFSMYRLKARKANDGDWVPILAQPEICREYSQSIVTTLHQKNLLLLGEDRFLSTLMIRTFPARKMMFCPQARCRTIAPDEFKVLLSQRRRWINSTIHNLMELVRVPNLCGTFCFSMQFVVFMDLLGTTVLPVAICLTYTLIINYIFNPPSGFSDAIPLLLLAAVLGLPAFLILLTSRKIIYVFWMGIYLLALPVWNFILPLYAFWHFDDFSWGETRKVAGGDKAAGHAGAGAAIGAHAVPMRRWEDWERSRIKKMRREEKRRREFERAFGTRQFHGAQSEIDTMSIISSADGDDRWGMAIGNYDEHDVSVPPVGLYSVDTASISDGHTLHSEEMEQMLEQGWDDEGKSPSPQRSPARTPYYGSPALPQNAPPPPRLHHVQLQDGGDRPAPTPYSSTAHLIQPIDDTNRQYATAVDTAPAWQGHVKRRSGSGGGHGYAQ